MSAPPAINATALDPARSVVVEACAGSGKTWLLVSRIVRLLLAGARPGEIVAITFTRKAAQEMAARLREWLLQLATGSDDEVHNLLVERSLAADACEALLPRARTLYESLLTAEPGITITTFHSWFMHLLRRAPLESGALGAASLIEQTSMLIDEAWDRFALALQRSPDHAAAAPLDRLFRNCGLANTQSLLRTFMHHRADWWATTSGMAPEQALEEVLDTLRAEFGITGEDDPRAALAEDAGFRSALAEYGALLARNTKSDQADATRLAATLDGDPLARFEAARSVLLTQKHEPCVRKPSDAQRRRLGLEGESRLLELHGELAHRLVDARLAWCDLEAWRFNADALTCGVALLDTYQQVKRDAQAIDYGDIEWRTRALLASPEHAAYMQYKLDARYRHVLLDEFQDTNPLQWLTLKSWFGAAAEAGSRPGVFLVGDPKQSIYRFRRAEARLFADARRYLESSFGAQYLAQNETRRCATAVVEVLDALFTAPGVEYEGYERHQVHDARKPGRVEVLPLAAHQKQERQRDEALRDPLAGPLPIEEDLRREHEARQVVEGIRRIVAQWEIHDRGRIRAARHGDIMLLVRQRTHLVTYERALRGAGIPFVTSRQGGLLDTLEACDITALLEFLVSPFANLNLAHALRTPIFGCSDEDMMRIASTAGGSWWERLQRIAQEADCPEALARAHRLLASWLDAADALPVHDQLDRIYFEGDVLERYRAAVAVSQRAAVVGNLEAYIQRALEIGAGRYPSLPRFLVQLADLRAAPPEEAPAEASVDGAGEAVRILTVHGAKGLEAPVVWLLDTASTSRSSGYGVLVDWPPGDERPRHFSVWARRDAMSRAQQAHYAEDERIAAREDLNLLYVAMTRAEQALVVSGCDGRSTAASWHARLRQAVLDAGGHENADGVVVWGAAMTRATDVVPERMEPAAPSVDDALLQPIPVGTRAAVADNAGTRYGTYFHAYMEQATSGRPLDEALSSRYRLTPREHEAVAAQVRALVGRQELARYFDASRYRSAANEVAYVDAAGNVRRIDRIVEFDEEVWVLDYKTGRPGEDAALEQAYREQLVAYCEAARALFSGKKVKGMLLFADGRRVVLEDDGKLVPAARP
jgi:ATP-dependent helicase/nuclease subunit A